MSRFSGLAILFYLFVFFFCLIYVRTPAAPPAAAAAILSYTIFVPHSVLCDIRKRKRLLENAQWQNFALTKIQRTLFHIYVCVCMWLRYKKDRHQRETQMVTQLVQYQNTNTTNSHRWKLTKSHNVNTFFYVFGR